MKITKGQLKKIIKEELAKESHDGRTHPSQVKPAVHGYDDAGFSRTEPASIGGNNMSVKDDIKDAIQMLESVEDTTGSLFYVIERLYTALEKV